MVKLFLADIDGCLASPYEPYDLDGFRRLSEWGRRAETDPAFPRLGICSGRPYSYVEAVAQALDLRGPALFESGSGRFDLPTASIRWNPRLTPEIEEQLRAVRAYIHRDVLPDTGLSYDYGKRAQSGVVSASEDEIEHWAEVIDRWVNASFPDLATHSTPVSIDVIPRVMTKEMTVRQTADEEGIDIDEVAFIGDTGGDIGALKAVGFSFAPQNAQTQVKEIADVVTDGAVLDGVIEAYEWCVRHNEAALASV